MSNQFPGANLFGERVEQHRRRRDIQPAYNDSDDSDNDIRRDVESADEHESDYDSDDGTIYSTREAMRRTPAQIKYAEMVRREALFQELCQMKRDGVPLSREYTKDDPIELMSNEIDRYKQNQNENTMVGMYKVVLNMGCHGLQMLNTVKGPWLPMEGWAEAVTADMNVYDRPLRRIHRQYFARGGPAGNPWVELGFAIIGSLIFHIMVAKMMNTQNGAAMFAKMMNGGVMNAIPGVANMMGGGGNVGPSAGIPQGVPNAGNPFGDRNVPHPIPRPAPVPTQPAYQQPAPAPAPAPMPMPAPRANPNSTRQRQRRPMRRPTFINRAPQVPATPPPSRSPPPSTMDSESTMNLDDDDDM